jgi:hypothetical protein
MYVLKNKFDLLFIFIFAFLAFWYRFCGQTYSSDKLLKGIIKMLAVFSKYTYLYGVIFHKYIFQF